MTIKNILCHNLLTEAAMGERAGHKSLAFFSSDCPLSLLAPTLETVHNSKNLFLGVRHPGVHLAGVQKII